MVKISNWWLNNFVADESNVIMFRYTDASYNDVQDFKKEFAEVTKLNIDLLNLFIHHYKLNKDKISKLTMVQSDPKTTK